MTGPRIFFLLGFLAVSACGGWERDITLHDLRTNQKSPEEFSILPVKPLQEPPDFKALPAPTPGGANRTDQTPNADAVAVLGGNPGALSAGGGIPGGDGALVTHANRFGANPSIRKELADEDLAYRKRKSLFTWSIVPRDDYFRAYQRLMLDPYAELERWRRAGARVPAAPPGGR